MEMSDLVSEIKSLLESLQKKINTHSFGVTSLERVLKFKFDTKVNYEMVSQLLR